MKEYASFGEMMNDFQANEPRKIKGSELDGWNGLEGTGWIAELGLGDDAYAIVMDVTQDGITLGQYFMDGTCGGHFTLAL